MKPYGVPSHELITPLFARKTKTRVVWKKRERAKVKQIINKIVKYGVKG
jgi:hypothetical protein